MDSLAVGFLGALVGGALGLGGAWLVARSALNSTRMTEQLALIAAERARLETLYAPLTEFLRELWVAFTRHMDNLIREPGAAYQPDQQSALNIQAQIRSVLTDLQSRIADLDREAAAVVGRGSVQRRLPWRHRQ